MRLAVLVLVVGCGDGGGFPDAFVPPPPVDPGTFSLTWSLKDATGATTTCDAVGATTVHVGVVDAVSGAQFSQSFACSLASASSGVLPSKTYNVDFELNGASGMIATGPAQMGVVIMPDKSTQLADVAFMTP